MGHGNNPPERLFDRAGKVPHPLGDKLLLLMERQDSFLNEVLDRHADRWGTRTELLKEQVLMLIAEATELLEHMPWKKHRKDYGRDLTAREREAVLEETVDILHFVFNLFLLLGVNTDMVYRLYIAKNDINRERQRGGY